jgi:hypothetical protein
MMRPSGAMNSRSSGMSVFFIQNVSTCGDGKMNSMPSCGLSRLTNISPCACLLCVSAIQTWNMWLRPADSTLTSAVG